MVVECDEECDEEPYLLTTLVALPLLDLECQVEGADGEVDGLGVHSPHLADKRGSPITFQRLPLRTAEGESERERPFEHVCKKESEIDLSRYVNCVY